MINRHSFGIAAVTTAFIGTAAAALLTTTASAMPTDNNQCNAGDLTASITDNGPGAGSDTYSLDLAAKPGVSCEVGGSPQLTQFLQPDGSPANISTTSANPDTWPTVTIDATHSAEISIKTANEPGQPVTALHFNVPSGGEDTITTIPWTPGSIASDAQFSTAQSIPATS
jgi:hypothetical protein